MKRRSNLRRISGCLVAALWAAVAWGTACGADAPYPVRPIRLILPFAPGGGADALARILAPKLHDVLGQNCVVDNRPGAGGTLAADLVVHATPDGYTVFEGFNTVLTVNPTLYKLSFDMAKGLQPVTLLATAQYILVVNPKVPVHTVQGLIALAKREPGTLNYATAGVGTPLHLAGALFDKRAGINMVPVAYKGGGLAAAAVLAGEAQVIFGSVAASMPMVKAGRLRALATTGTKRSKVAPDLPTIAESGFPGFDVGSWYAFLVPAGMPASVVKRLREAALKVLALPEVQLGMARQGLEPETSTPAELATRIKRETAMWAAVIREQGIKTQ